MGASFVDVPPHNLNAERNVLFSMYLDEKQRATHKAVMALSSHDFYSPRNQNLFRALRELYEEGAPTDDLTLLEDRLSKGRHPVPDALEYLLDEVINHPATNPTHRYVEHYIRIVQDAAARRRKIQSAMEASDLLRMGDVEAAERLLAKASVPIEGRTVLASHDQQVDELLVSVNDLRDGGTTGVTTGFDSLDRLIGDGFQPGCSYVLAGLTSMGKTALAIQMVLAAAQAGTPVHYWSLEMSSKLLMMRLAAYISGVCMRRDAAGRWTEDERERVNQAIQVIRNLPIRIDTQTRVLDQMALQAKALRGKVGIFVIDHGLLVNVPGSKSEYQAITQVSGAAKSIAGETGASVLLLSQFNREAAKDGQGQTHQLRGSGALEQDADVIMTVKREGYQDKTGSARDNARVEVSKQRITGRIGFVDLKFDTVLGRFWDPRAVTR